MSSKGVMIPENTCTFLLNVISLLASPVPSAIGIKQNLSSTSPSLTVASTLTRVEKDGAGIRSRDRTARRDVVPSAAAAASTAAAASAAAAAAEDTSSEIVDSNGGDMNGVAAALTDAFIADAADADVSDEPVVLSSLLEEADAIPGVPVQEGFEAEFDGDSNLVTWQPRDAAAVARQLHPHPLPQALFAPDIILPPQQAAALAGGSAPPKRQPTKPFISFMEGLNALQCVSQSGVQSLDIERIFPLGPCNDSLR
jgi:hypothetical protein